MILNDDDNGDNGSDDGMVFPFPVETVMMPSGASLTFTPVMCASPGIGDGCCDHSRCETTPDTPVNMSIASFLNRWALFISFVYPLLK